MESVFLIVLLSASLAHSRPLITLRCRCKIFVCKDVKTLSYTTMPFIPLGHTSFHCVTLAQLANLENDPQCHRSGLTETKGQHI